MLSCGVQTSRRHPSLNCLIPVTTAAGLPINLFCVSVIFYANSRLLNAKSSEAVVSKVPAKLKIGLTTNGWTSESHFKPTVFLNIRVLC